MSKEKLNPPASSVPLGRFLSNTYDPTRPHAEAMHCYSFHAYNDINSRRHEWQMHLNWINANIITRPKATATYTVEQLEAMGMVGLYAHPEETTNDGN